VFSIATRNLIRIEPEWVPCTENQQADYLSRIQDGDDWMVRPEVFSYIDALWGPHEVDRFANNFNAQLARFNSRFWCPGTDTFTCNWGQDLSWVCPSTYLILRSIRHAAETSAVGTLVVPSCPSAWPMIFPGRNDTPDFVREIIVLPKHSQVLLPGRQGSILPACDLLAVHFDFASPSAQQ